ncbi:hypothetical protein AGMMS50239_38000 [Bacteroidia bacterium]|nr:hypothetical protein AGMMS50239_38000 [Bacteroidia bacterium]
METKSIKKDNNFYFNLDGHGKQYMGSFESAIRDAYKKGSTGNQAKLEIAFPEHFKPYSSVK